MSENVVTRLRESADAFENCVVALSDEVFLRKFSEWSPRDVLAHLIGWNGYTLIGCRQIRNGKAPFYLSDEPNDFSTVNAASVQQYSSQDKQLLLGELERSLQALLGFLRALDPADWEREHGAHDDQGRPEMIRAHVRRSLPTTSATGGRSSAGHGPRAASAPDARPWAGGKDAA